MKKAPFKINFYLGKEQAQDACTCCQQRYGQSDLNQAEVQVVLGGDGSILTALKEQIKLGVNIPIFGLNYGSKGWLANDGAINDLYRRIQQAQKQVITPLQITLTSTVDGKRKVAYAFNEFSVLRSSPQAVHLPLVLQDEKMKFHLYLEGDGVIMATPMGSNAYYATMGGKPLDMSQKAMLVRSINAVKPFDLLMSEKTKLGIGKYQGEKRPMMVEGDGERIENVSRAVVRYAFDKRKTLLFDACRKRQR